MLLVHPEVVFTLLYVVLRVVLRQFPSLPVLHYVGDLLPLRITPRTPLLGDVPTLHGSLRLVLMYPEETVEPRKTVVREDGGQGLIITHWSDVGLITCVCVCVHACVCVCVCVCVCACVCVCVCVCVVCSVHIGLSRYTLVLQVSHEIVLGLLYHSNS